MIEYDVVSVRDPELIAFDPEFDSSWVDEWTSAVVRRRGGKIVEVLGTDGGEPEDQTLTRDWAWVAPALRDAYRRGRDRATPRDVLDMD